MPGRKTGPPPTLRALVERIDARVGGMDARLEGVDARLEGVDARLERMNARLEGVDARLEGVDARLEKVSARVEDMDARLDGVSRRVEGMDARLEKVSTGVETMHVEVNARLAAHEAGLIELGMRAHDHDTLLQSLAVKVDSQGVLLDLLQDQNRLTIEAIENTRAALEQRIERLDQDSRARDGLLEVAIRELRVTLQQTTLDVHDLSGKVDRLVHLDERVSALERRRE